MPVRVMSVLQHPASGFGNAGNTGKERMFSFAVIAGFPTAEIEADHDTKRLQRADRFLIRRRGEMTKLSDFQGNWLKGSDLQGKEWPVTIEKVVPEEVGDSEKLVARFVDRRKSLPLNQGHLAVLALAFGDDTENCRGGRIILYPERTRTPRGESAVGVRIKMPGAAAVPAADATFVPNARERGQQAEQQATQPTQQPPSAVQSQSFGETMDDEIPF